MRRHEAMLVFCTLSLALLAVPTAAAPDTATPGEATAAGPPQSGSAGAFVPPAGWRDEVQEGIREAEYEASWQSRAPFADLAAGWQAPNRAHGLRTWFAPRGPRIVPRAGEAPAWELGLALRAIARGSARLDLEEVEPSAAGHRVEYRRGLVDEWYVNDARGLEQGFTIPARPPIDLAATGGTDLAAVASPGRAAADMPGRPISPPTTVPVFTQPSDSTAPPLALELELTGTLAPYVAEDGQSVAFRTHEGDLALRYTGTFG